MWCCFRPSVADGSSEDAGAAKEAPGPCERGGHTDTAPSISSRRGSNELAAKQHTVVEEEQGEALSAAGQTSLSDFHEARSVPMALLASQPFSATLEDLLFDEEENAERYDCVLQAGLLQQDLSNMKQLHSTRQSLLFHADWRGAPVAVKLLASAEPLNLQEAVIQSMHLRKLAHPHILHTYVALEMELHDDEVEHALDDLDGSGEGVTGMLALMSSRVSQMPLAPDCDDVEVQRFIPSDFQMVDSAGDALPHLALQAPGLHARRGSMGSQSPHGMRAPGLGFQLSLSPTHMQAPDMQCNASWPSTPLTHTRSRPPQRELLFDAVARLPTFPGQPSSSLGSQQPQLAPEAAAAAAFAPLSSPPAPVPAPGPIEDATSEPLPQPRERSEAQWGSMPQTCKAQRKESDLLSGASTSGLLSHKLSALSEAAGDAAPVRTESNVCIVIQTRPSAEAPPATSQQSPLRPRALAPLQDTTSDVWARIQEEQGKAQPAQQQQHLPMESTDDVWARIQQQRVQTASPLQPTSAPAAAECTDDVWARIQQQRLGTALPAASSPQPSSTPAVAECTDDVWARIQQQRLEIASPPQPTSTPAVAKCTDDVWARIQQQRLEVASPPQPSSAPFPAESTGDIWARILHLGPAPPAVIRTPLVPTVSDPFENECAEETDPETGMPRSGFLTMTQAWDRIYANAEPPQFNTLLSSGSGRTSHSHGRHSPSFSCHARTQSLLSGGASSQNAAAADLSGRTCDEFRSARPYNLPSTSLTPHGQSGPSDAGLLLDPSAPRYLSDIAARLVGSGLGSGSGDLTLLSVSNTQRHSSCNGAPPSSSSRRQDLADFASPQIPHAAPPPLLAAARASADAAAGSGRLWTQPERATPQHGLYATAPLLGNAELNDPMGVQSADFALACDLLTLDQALEELKRQLPEGPNEAPFVTITVAEFCDRGCLRDVTEPGFAFGTQWFNWGTAMRALLRTAKEIAQGLEYLHSIHITHGNLNPLNVLFKTSHLDRRGFTVRLGDFGYSAVHGLDDIDHLAYVAPEVVRGNTPTPASDIWSYGMIIYEMITGKQPLAHLEPAELRSLLADRPAELLGLLQLPACGSVHPVLRRTVCACLDLDPQLRPVANIVAKVMVKLDHGLRQEVSIA